MSDKRNVPGQAPRWFGSPEEFAARMIPHYGKFGGPMWTGGQWFGSLDEDPIDALDSAFKAHDAAYGEAKHPVDIITADRALISYLENYLKNKTYLEDKAVDTDERRLEAHRYAVAALKAFRAKNGVQEQPLRDYRSGMDALGRSRLEQAIPPGMALPFSKISHTVGDQSDPLTRSATPPRQYQQIEASIAPFSQPRASGREQMMALPTSPQTPRSLGLARLNREHNPISSKMRLALDNTEVAGSPGALPRQLGDGGTVETSAINTGTDARPIPQAARNNILEILKRQNDGRARMATGQDGRDSPISDSYVASNAYVPVSKIDRVAMALLKPSAEPPLINLSRRRQLMRANPTAVI